MIDIIKRIMEYKQRFQKKTTSNLLWLLNFLPSIAGFPILSKKFNVFIWAIHNILLFYVCLVGIVVYQIYDATDFIDSIYSFFSLSVFVVIFNGTLWRQCKRNEINYILELAIKNDELIINSGRYIADYRELLKNIERTVIACHVFHFVNDLCIYIPSRILSVDAVSVAGCVGLEPLTSSPNREICRIILTLQVMGAATVLCNNDAILLFVFAHASAVFKILALDLVGLNDLAMRYDNTPEKAEIIMERLKNIIHRHSSVLYTVRKMQEIYSATIGIGFGLNAITICIFFVLPLDVCLNFAALISYDVFSFFLYCYQGQILTNASEKFETAVYFCGWENLNVDMRKYVLLLLRQAQKPVVVNVAGVIPLCMYTFACTMQNIYKFGTVFKL